MSCSTSSVVAAGDGYRTPFTAVQWQELEHQALIYKYLVAGLPVPPDLVVPIRRSLEALSARFFHHPTLGYCSYYGKKFDPEPGRCRRTDGKKWRCSKDAYPDSKYCERHMHRGRNRSRKPVESHSQSTSSSSSSISTVISSHIASGGTTAAAGGTGSLGSFQSGSAGESCYQNLPLYVNSNSENLCFGSNASKLNMDNVAYGINNKEYSGRYIDAPNNFSLGGYNNNTESNTDASWPLMGSSLLKSNTLNPSQLVQMPQAFERQQQQHCLFGSEIGSPKRVKQEGNSMRSFFDEWPKARESWPSDHLDDDVNGRSSDNKTMNAFSSTQLSMSIPMAHPSDYSSSRNACSPDDA